MSTPITHTAASSLKLSRFVARSEAFVDARDSRAKRVVFATRTAQARILDERTWRDLSAGSFALVPKEMLFELIDIELLVPAAEDELRTILSRNDAAKADDQDLYVVVQPTAWCQLGCDYCGQLHGRRSLRKDHRAETGDRVEAQLVATGAKRLTIGWFGAEPLVGLPVIRDLTSRFREITSRLGRAYDSKVVTNGLGLTAEVARELQQDLAVKFVEVTLDGIADDHNVRRLTKTGRPTFNRILGNLLAAARDPDITFGLGVRCNVDGRNHRSVKPLLELLAKEGVQKRVQFYVAPVHSWGNDAHQLAMTPEEFASFEIDIAAQMIQLGFSVNLLPRRRPVVCMADMQHAELIDADGNIFDCTEVSYVPAYGNPNRHAIGNLGTGVTRERSIARSYREGVDAGQYPCSSCEMLPVCGGSCPKQWLEGIAPCPSAKHNITTRLLLAFASSRLGDDVVD